MPAPVKPYGQRMGANDYDHHEQSVSVVLKSRARDEDDEAIAEGLEDYDWLDAPMVGLRDGDVRMSAKPCPCGQPRRYHARWCDTCREARAKECERAKDRRNKWRRLPAALTVRTCACGIVFALKYEEAKCSICRVRPCDRRDMKVKTCACGARFAARGRQAWCDGCRLKARKDSKEETR